MNTNKFQPAGCSPLTAACITAVCAVLLAAASCTHSLQQQIDQQNQVFTQATGQLQQSLSQVRQHQADYQSSLDEIRREIQFLKGSLEESNYRTQKDITGLKTGLDQMQALYREQLQKQVRPPSPGSSGAPTDPAGEAASSDEGKLYNAAYSSFTSGKFSRARSSFRKFLEAYPDSDLSDNALYWIGNCYFKEGKFEEAIAAFDDVIKKFPRGNKVPDAYYLQALSFCEINDPLTARILLETLIQNFPTSSAALSGKTKYKQLQAN